MAYFYVNPIATCNGQPNIIERLSLAQYFLPTFTVLNLTYV